MQVLLHLFLWLACAGFVASLVVHVASLLGQPNPLGAHAWKLHIGIFVVWIPAALASQRLAKGARSADFWKAVLRGCPPWIRTALYVVAGYAALNFIAFVALAGVRERTDPLSGFSGHWLVFYSVAAATLYSTIRLGASAARTCPNGHEVSPLASCCERCGAQVPVPPIA